MMGIMLSVNFGSDRRSVCGSSPEPNHSEQHGEFAVTFEADRRFVELLSRIVQRSREMQEKGRLQDPVSRAEVQLLEHQLKMAKARLAMDMVRAGCTIDERARALVSLAEEACQASQAIRKVSSSAHQRSRCVRKRLYRARLIHGAL